MPKLILKLTPEFEGAKKPKPKPNSKFHRPPTLGNILKPNTLMILSVNVIAHFLAAEWCSG